MFESLGSFKTLEEVHLKATYNMRIGDKEFEEGETIALFNKIQISNLTEFKDFVAATGGFDNRGHVFWERTQSLQLNFSQGVFSNTQFAILNNAHVFNMQEGEPILVTTIERTETSREGFFTMQKPLAGLMFVYNEETGEKCPWRYYQNHYIVDVFNTNIVIIYQYDYTNGATVLRIGQKFLNGFVSLEGKTRVKDDTSGLITTGIIRIPKLKLMSGLSIRLGAQASPVVGNFSAVGVPVESRYNSYVMEFDFLNNDIDSDM